MQVVGGGGGGHWSRGDAAWTVRAVHPGISTKVLNERLRKLLDYGVVKRTKFPGKVLRVEYQLSATGRKLEGIIEQLRDLEEEHAQGHQDSKGSPTLSNLEAALTS